MSKTVLVVGGAGYIGAHTCKELAAHGYSPLVYDNFYAGHADFVRWGGFTHGDILDTAKLCEVMHEHKPAGVIHFASCINVGESVHKPGKYYANNFNGTLSLVEAMRMAGVNNLVVSSTCAIYGEPEIIPIGEDTPFNPMNPYGASKAFMERMLDDFAAAHGLRFAALRYFNASGADPEAEVGERHEPETHLIPNVFRAAAGLIPALQLFGDDYPTPDGTCVRDYIHVCDLASAHRLALERLVQDKLAQGEKVLRLNLGTGRGYSVREIIENSERITGRKVPYSIVARRAGDVPFLVAKADLALEKLGWRPEHSSLENILTTAWRWFVKDNGI